MSKRRKPQPRMPRREKPVGLSQFVAEAQKPGLSILRIEHDDDCRHWRGKECSCDPEIRLVRPFEGEEQGSIRR